MSKNYRDVYYIFSKREHKAYRQFLGYNQTQWADLTGLSLSYVEKLERPTLPNIRPTANVMKTIQVALKITNDEITRDLPKALDLLDELEASGRRFKSEYPHYKPFV